MGVCSSREISGRRPISQATLRKLKLGIRDKLKFARRVGVPASSHTVDRDRQDVQSHYDLSDEFFRLFLDEKMVYSCAYFASPEQDLDRAQERKLDLICRKLDLRPGDRFLDAGCGWGALLIWAARHYGVRAPYLRSVYRALRPGGVFLNHGITAPRRGPAQTGGTLIFRHVFPGAELSPVTHLQAEMEDSDFEILDVHALRQHYALTLRAWFERFMARRAEAARMVPERVIRIWDLYLAGAARAFQDGVIGVRRTSQPARDRRRHPPLPGRLQRRPQALRLDQDGRPDP